MTAKNNRWTVLNVIFLILYVLGYNSLKYYSTLPNYVYFIIFNLTIIIILAFNFFRLRNLIDKKSSINPYKNVPTTSSLFRTLTAFGLSFTILTNKYSWIIAFAYLAYFYIISSTYDLSKYHDYAFREIRIIFDLLFSSIAYVYLGGINNIVWLMFLIPISTTARHYRTWKPLSVTTISILFLCIASFTVSVDNFQRINFWDIFNNIGAQFSNYLNSDIKNEQNWQSFKQLIVAVFFFLYAASIFKAETKSRLKSVFDFNKSLHRYIGSHKKSINTGLLNKLCIDINVESVISFNEKSNKLICSFQTHTISKDYDSKCESGDIDINNETKTELIDWCKNVFKIYGKHFKDFNDYSKSMKWFKKDVCIYLIGDEEIIQVVHNEAKNLINKFERIVFEKIPSINIMRETAELLLRKDIVSIVPIRINDTYIIFINNLPSKYRLVQRTFWDDSLQKIRLIKYQLS